MYTPLEIEDRLRKMLETSQPPEPKYKLWDQVDKGQIVGMRFDSVGFAFHQGSVPGW